jgi:hypothetical protein
VNGFVHAGSVQEDDLAFRAGDNTANDVAGRLRLVGNDGNLFTDKLV